MEQQLTLHIVGGTSRSRAEQARFVFSRGHHAEVYADLAELLHRPIAHGMVIASGEVLEAGVSRLIDALGAAGTWLPVIAASEEMRVEQIVDAVRAGALDFCPLPLEHGEFDRLLARNAAEGAAHVATRRSIRPRRCACIAQPASPRWHARMRRRGALRSPPFAPPPPPTPGRSMSAIPSAAPPEADKPPRRRRRRRS